MTFAPDDLAQLFVAPQREHTGYGQGVLTAWNPDTFENAVSYRGATLTNLPVMDRIGALTYQPGDVVLLMRWAPSGGGLSSYWIAGSPVIPAEGRAEQAIAFMSSTLVSALLGDFVSQLLTSPEGQELAAFVMGARMFTATDGGIGTRNNTGYGNLTGASAGPSISGVPITSAGKAIVLQGCMMNFTNLSTSAARVAFMSTAISGATTRASNDGWAYTVGLQGDSSLAATRVDRAVAGSLQEGLNPGSHTFTCQYRTLTTAGAVQFSARTLIVMAF